MDVRLSIDDRCLIERVHVTPNIEEGSHALLDQWWKCYQTGPEELRGEHACVVQNYLNDMLTRRLKLPSAAQLRPSDTNRSLLEGLFENVTSSLLGFDSVTVGLSSDSPDQRRSRALEKPTLPLPSPINIRSVPIDRTASRGAVEKLAAHVPEECLYVRCPSASNYLWLRSILLEWGGTLEEVVAPHTYDHQIRPRVEKRLALRADDEARASLTPLIGDMALIALDPYFQDGAACGVLFQARPAAGGKLAQWIEDQRRAIRKGDVGNIQDHHISTTTGKTARLLASRDGQVRSYYVTYGDFHLVTNCERLVDRFVEAGAGMRNLAGLDEFVYARGQFPTGQQDVFIYLSDPFFRMLASPAYCVEYQRRVRSAADIRTISLAVLAARGERQTCRSLDELVDAGFLPEHFVARSDGIRLRLEGDSVIDLDRGQPGTFRPIADTRVSQCTSSELQSYQKFAGQIRSEWGLMDPVAVVLNRVPQANGREQVQMEIKITPYARQRYAALRTALAPASNRRIRHDPSDMLSLETMLRGPTSTFPAYLGLADARIDFDIADGTIEIKNSERTGSTYALSHAYVALGRSDDEALQVVEDLLRSFGFRPSSLTRLFVDVFSAPVTTFKWLVGAPPRERSSPERFLPRPTAAANGWGMLSFNDNLAQAAASSLELAASADEPAQIRFAMRDVIASRVGPYIRAYSYVEARRASAANAQLLESFLDQLQVPSSELPSAVRQALGVELTCPLSGELLVRDVSNQGRYVYSDKWRQRSFHELTDEIPDDYEFPFIAWLRGFKLQFRLDDQTLSTKAQLDICPSQSRLQPVSSQTGKHSKEGDWISGRVIGNVPRTMHNGTVWSLAFSPDSLTLASASDDHTAKLWDPRTGELKRTLVGHTNLVRSVVFAPDGKTLVTAGFDNKLYLWNAETGQLQRTFTDTAAAFFPVFIRQGDLLSASHEPDIRLWDLKTGQLKGKLKGHSATAWALAASRDGSMMASGGWDQTVRVWDLRTNKMQRLITGHGGTISVLAFSPDGNTLASVTNNAIHLWNVQTGALLHKISGHVALVYHVAFSPDGTLLVSAGGERITKLWNVKTGELIRTLNGGGFAAAFSPDGKTLAGGGDDSLVRLWDCAKLVEPVTTMPH